MSSGDQSQAIVVVERLRNVLAERVTRATGRDPPATPIIGIRPQEVAHGTLVGDLLDAIQSPNVVQRVDTRRQAAMKTEDLVFDQGGQGEIVEQVGEVLPDVGVAVFAEALVVEAVDLGDLAGLVVPTEDGDALGVSDLEGHEEGDGLDGVVATIDVVAWSC